MLKDIGRVSVQHSRQFPWMERAVQFADKKIMNTEYFQVLALLSIAEAMHRLAEAVESQARAGPSRPT